MTQNGKETENAKNANNLFFTKLQKTEMETLTFCVMTFGPIEIWTF